MSQQIDVVIIEDEEDIGNLYKAVIEKAGLSCNLQTDGISGLTFVRQNKPKLVLLDIMLPGLNGLDILSKLKADQETSLITVVMLSNLGDDATIEVAKSRGAFDFLVKVEFAPADVIARIYGYLGQKPQAGVV